MKNYSFRNAIDRLWRDAAVNGSSAVVLIDPKELQKLKDERNRYRSVLTGINMILKCANRDETNCFQIQITAEYAEALNRMLTE